MKTFLSYAAKLVLCGAILAYAVYRARQDNPDVFGSLWQREKDWPSLLAAWSVCFAAVVLTILRWFLLVRIAHIPFRLSDALRLGFLGYLFNFVSLGNVGGDLFKAAFLVRERPDHRPQALASVVFDRVVGLYGLLLLTTAATWLLVDESAIALVRAVRQIVTVITVVATAAIGAALLPGFTTGPLSQWLSTLPRVGGAAGKLIGAVRLYRNSAAGMTAAVAMSLVSHSMFVIGIFLIARSLMSPPALAEHFIIVPLGSVVGALPLPLGALGAYEGGMQVLYEQIPRAPLPAGEGLLVALGYRVVMVAIAAVGAVIYLMHRKDVDFFRRLSRRGF